MSSANRPSQPDAGKQSLSPEIYRNVVEGSISPRSAAQKVVSIAEPESISPMMRGKSKEVDQGGEPFDLDKTALQFRASVGGKRLSGRPSSGSSRRQSLTGTPLSGLPNDEAGLPRSRPQSRHSHDNLVAQVSAWLKQEKSRRAARKASRKTSTQDGSQVPGLSESLIAERADGSADTRERRPSTSSESSIALDNLANILEKSLSLAAHERPTGSRKSSHIRRISSVMKLRRQSTAASSDTDYFDGEPIVPSCEAILDNSRILAYTGDAAESNEEISGPGKNTPKEKEAWATFKFEIVRLAHTLRLKGWRRVPMERSNDIEVERLSGALTNAVYVVSPPKNLPHPSESIESLPIPKNPPPKLILRIYGSQVEHLIDRESELQILRRLARKRIGPRLLGTFTNGRFEEFFHARTLTPKDLRVPDTSKQIAKRMRELHEGIDLLPQEREDGPFVWHNWDKWVERCEQIVTWLDKQVLEGTKGDTKSRIPTWKQHGFVCGVEWPIFRQTVEKYRKWLNEQYGGPEKVNERLVFAHNDTQYGNILRLIPAGESPLLLPANEHKQLVVIDFEYANANLPGLEFANHFSEWCYNYHDPIAPHLCTTTLYPTPEEQRRFIRSYLLHHPTFRGAAASNPPTPGLGPTTPSLRPVGQAHSGGTPTATSATATPSSSISTLMLDSRAPPERYQENEEKAERETDAEIQRLMTETRLWRLASSAQWVAWGILQAKVPGLPEWKPKEKGDGEEDVSPQAKKLESALLEEKDAAAGAEEDTEEEFDYLGYAQDRAWFFWGDAVQLGIVKAGDLPEVVQKKMKIVEY